MNDDKYPSSSTPSPRAGRRRLLRALSAASASRGLPAGVMGGVTSMLPTPGALAATPSCKAPSSPTESQTQGPYFTPDSPRRASLLETGLQGTRLLLTGRVLATDCTPLPAALLDFWQADANGRYDNRGYRLRGHQLADDEGRYRLETVLPGIYPGRTRHIHVRLQPAGGRLLITQLYFPGEVRNQADGLFSPALLVAVGSPADGAVMTAAFDFVVARG